MTAAEARAKALEVYSVTDYLRQERKDFRETVKGRNADYLRTLEQWLNEPARDILNNIQKGDN